MRLLRSRISRKWAGSSATAELDADGLVVTMLELQVRPGDACQLDFRRQKEAVDHGGVVFGGSIGAFIGANRRHRGIGRDRPAFGEQIGRKVVHPEQVLGLGRVRIIGLRQTQVPVASDDDTSPERALGLGVLQQGRNLSPAQGRGLVERGQVDIDDRPAAARAVDAGGDGGVMASQRTVIGIAVVRQAPL